MNDIDIKQYKSKNAYIVGGNVFYSYQTPIAINLNGVTFITANWYSVTTAHHKTDARRFFNNDLNIIVNHETLLNLINNVVAPEEVLKEYNLKQGLLKDLKNNLNSTFLITDLKVKDIIKSRRKPESKPYKNGNRLTRYYKVTSFKFIPNIQYQENVKHILKYVSHPDKGTFKTYDVVIKIVNRGVI